MPVSPFASPNGGGGDVVRNAAAQSLQERGAETGGAPGMETGKNPVAVKLFEATQLLLERGGVPEDLAAVKQFLDFLGEMQNGSASQGAPPPQAEAGPPAAAGPMPAGPMPMPAG